MWKKLLVGGLALVLGLAGMVSVGGVSAQESQVGVLVHDGLERTYTLYVPSSYDGETAVPLVVALHPFASSGKALEAITGFDQQAEAGGFMVVYPDVYDLGWDDGLRDTGWPSRLPRTDDLGFIAALIDELAANYAIDPAQVYLAGWGDGGAMAYSLACHMPERFAGVAVVNTMPWDYHLDACPEEPTAPVSLLMLLGTENVDYPRRGRTETLSNEDGTLTLRALDSFRAAQWWAMRNNCDLIEPELGDRFTEYVYDEGCEGGVTVSIRFLEGVSNTWPRDGDYTLNQVGLDATEIVMAFFFDELDDSLFEAHPAPEMVQYGDSPRGYILYVPPSYDPAEPMPLVVALHGRPGTAAGIAYLYDLNRVAAEHGFMALYPEGNLVIPGQRGREWNYTRGAPNYEMFTVDDVDFIGTMIDDLALDLNIDRQRLYITGFSNGGFMTQRLACEAADTYAAFAAVGSALFPHFIDVCESQPEAPILLMHGTLDKSIPWDGFVANGHVIAYSVPDTVIFWAMHNGCDPQAIEYTAIPQQDPAAPTSVHRYLMDACAAGTQVDYYVIEGGGHNLPGVVDRLEEDIAGTVNTDIHVSEVIWDFFSQFSQSVSEDDVASE